MIPEITTIVMMCMPVSLSKVPESSCDTACRNEHYDAGVEINNKCRCFDDWEKRVITKRDRVRLPKRYVNTITEEE